MTGGSELLERLRAATADEYVIEGELGLGGMAAVFLARDIALDRHVAIKVMRPDLVGVERIQERFVSEARTAARLDHPGIVSVYAVKQRAGLLFIIMKYVEGCTLESVLRTARLLDAPTAAAIAGPVADALYFAHATGVVHRDVKPSNILIDARGRTVVTDFGIARVMAAESFTVAGSMLGTPSYMSPEQCRGLPATAASDQYALGVTLYEMLTGRVPFTGGLFEVLDAHREQSPMPVSQLVERVEPMLEETVMRMLAKQPHDRWGSLAEVAQRLSVSAAPSRAILAALASPAGGPGSASTPLDLASPVPISSATPSPVMASPLLAPSASGASLDVAFLPLPSPEVAAPPLDAARPPTPDITEPPRPERSLAPGFEARRSRLGLVAAVATLVIALVILAISMIRRDSRGATASRSPDTQNAITATPPTPPPVIDSAATPFTPAAGQGSTTASSPATQGESTAVTRDPTTRPGPPLANSQRKVEPIAPPATPAPEGRMPPVPRSRPDSTRTARLRPESLGVECARLLERVSLGERLTDSERTFLQRSCNR